VAHAAALRPADAAEREWADGGTREAVDGTEQAPLDVTERAPLDALSLARFDDLPARTVAVATSAPAGAEAAPIRPVAPVATDAVVPAPPALPERSLAGELERFVIAAGLGDAVQVSVAGGGVTLSISDTIGFASGSAELLPDAAPVLAEVRDLVAARPDLAIEVSGHTDDRPLHAGVFRSNLDLSLARAARVAHELAGDDVGLTGRIFAAGYGAARPIASNDDADGRARNRRVELRLVRQ
jgi:chemotaxis protein MotB